MSAKIKYLFTKADIEAAKAEIETPKDEPRDPGIKGGALLALELPELHEFFAGLLPEGLGVIASPPKTGKSLLCYQMAAELTTGGALLGIKATDRAPVLYYALEDGQRRGQSRLRATLRGRTSGVDDITFRWTAPRIGNGLEDEVSIWLDANPAGLVIIDVLAKVRPRGKAGLNAYDEDYSALNELHITAKNHPGSSILLVTHDRKAGSDDWMTRITGTRGITGAADYVIYINRKRGEDVGKIAVTGREVADKTFDVKFTEEGWEVATVADLIPHRSPTRQKIYEWLTVNGPAQPAAIALGTGLERNVVHHRVIDMAKDGELALSPAGYRVPDALDRLTDARV